MKFNDNPITSIKLVSISFPGRDLSLAPVSIKSYILKDPEISKKFTISISQFDINGTNEDIFQALDTGNEQIYGFTVYVWNFEKILVLAEKLKKSNPERQIVLGGPEASGLAEQILEKYEFIDFVFNGEGESAFKLFLTNKDLTSVPGLVYRNNGLVLSNPEVQMKSLEELALPYESQDYRAYLENSETPVRAAIETSRGCPFSCAYCTWGERKMKYFSLEKLKPAFEFLFNHRKVKTIYITDSNPFLRKERSLELLNFLIKANMHKKPVTFEVSPEYLTNERIVKLISQLNNEEFAFGVQSTAPEVLSRIKRKFNSDLYRKNIKLIRKQNKAVEFWFSLIIGLPGDNYTQFVDSVEFVLKLKPEGIYFHELLCLPGSDLYKNPSAYGIQYMEDPPHKLISNETFPQIEYNQAKQLAYLIYLLHRTSNLNKRFFNLFKHQNGQGLRLVDYYIQFQEFLTEQLDILGGKSIQEISSWFFEQTATNFLQDQQKVEQLTHLVHSFETGVTS
ncbi:MAG: B12-binding domain-containing radical SAM protein [Candidatus Hodarchaeales archaeon]|jgi:radical SAM superfamily enzyme YgiQ (UPF0313 family)